MRSSPFEISFILQVVIAVILGILVGILVPKFGVELRIIANSFYPFY